MDEAPDNLAPLILRKDEERRLLAGHSWIYSNEKQTPLYDYQGVCTCALRFGNPAR